ncbi:hypothetical protein GCM10028857_01650 [Salinarchaeum chitinilyticum]
MFDDTDRYPSGVPVARVVLVVCLVVAGALVVAAYAGVLADQYRGNPTPQASFAFDYDDETETLTVRHQAGDDVDGRYLYVVVANRSAANFSAHETVSSGDSITVAGVTRSDDVRVVWWNGIRYTELARWR